VIRVNGVDRDFVSETVEEMIRRLSIEPRGVAVAIDGDVVSRSEWRTTPIEDGCTIEIVTAVAGG
jgi:sulfur carrier protein